MGLQSPLNYTSGHWTVTSLTTDTVTAGKTLTIPDLSYALDYAKTSDEPTEATLANLTSVALGTMETLRYAKSDVKNVYANTQVGASNQMPVKTGVRTLVEANVLIQAANSVSGEEFLIPVRAWTCVQIPTASFISDAVLGYAMGRALGAMFDTGVATTSREEAVARGSLLPN